MIEQSLIDECRKLGGVSAELADAVEKIMRKPYYDSFVVLLTVKMRWDEQLIKTPIDIFSEASDKSFDRGKKYLDDIGSITETLSNLQNKLSTEEAEQAKGQAKAAKDLTAPELVRMRKEKEMKNGAAKN